MACAEVATTPTTPMGNAIFRPPPHSSAPNEPIKMAFGTRDYVVETTPPANFHLPTPVSLPPGKG